MQRDLFRKCHAWVSNDDDVPVIPGEQCLSYCSCKDIREAFLDKRFLERVAVADGRLLAYALRELPIKAFIAGKTGDDSRQSLCEICIGALSRHYDSCRKYMFSALPRYFGLGTWKEVMGNTTESE